MGRADCGLDSMQIMTHHNNLSSTFCQKMAKASTGFFMLTMFQLPHIQWTRSIRSLGHRFNLSRCTSYFLHNVYGILNICPSNRPDLLWINFHTSENRRLRDLRRSEAASQPSSIDGWSLSSNVQDVLISHMPLTTKPCIVPKPRLIWSLVGVETIYVECTIGCPILSRCFWIMRLLFFFLKSVIPSIQSFSPNRGSSLPKGGDMTILCQAFP